MEGEHNAQLVRLNSVINHYKQESERLLALETSTKGGLTAKGIDIEDPDLDVAQIFRTKNASDSSGKSAHVSAEPNLVVKLDSDTSKEHCDTVSRSEGHEDCVDRAEECRLALKLCPETVEDGPLFELDSQRDNGELRSSEEQFRYIPPAFAQVFGGV